MALQPLPNCELDLAEALPALREAGLFLACSPQAQALKSGKKAALRIDSRTILAGDAFLALAGTRADGHAHVPLAREKGAGLVLIEKRDAAFDGAWILVKNTRAAWAHLAARAFGEPQKKLKMIAVTGTNGKSSTVWMIRQLLEAVGVPCLSIGTLGAYLGDEFRTTSHTTPDPDVLYGLMALAAARGIAVGAMEASSHAIVQEKMRPLTFQAAAFTSFSRDHLDFHPTMAAYFAEKWRLFTERTAPGATCVFSAGIRELRFPIALPGKRIIVYGANVSGLDADDFAEYAVDSTGFTGTSLVLRSKGRVLRGKIPYFAPHALENFAAALTLAAAVDERVLDPLRWPRLLPVPGRLEQVIGKKPARIVVDYAHTPDALDKTLRTLRPFCAGKLAVVFGCGGDRDRGKRPEMGKIAEDLADRVYLTSDNPRSEEPDAILADIAQGLSRPENAVLDADRERAIARAIADAAPDDLVLIAGKGHETYQILRAGTVPFDDRLVAQKHLNG